MERKEDRRVTMTKKMLKDALLEMLQTQDIRSISIRELCEHADVNRTTFYKHYGSQYDLLKEMEDSMLEFINRICMSDRGSDYDNSVAVFRYLEEHREFARLMINNAIDPEFSQRLYLQTFVHERLEEYIGSEEDPATREYLSGFLTAGSYELLKIWLNKERRESPEEIADIFRRIFP